MTSAARLALFAVLLAAVFGVATLAGAAIDPTGAPADSDRGGHGEERDEGGEARASEGGDHGDVENEDGGADAGSHRDGDARDHVGDAVSGSAPSGLASAAGGFRLVAARTRYETGRAAQPFSFRIVRPDARPLREYDVEHAKRMHLIVVRRDLRGFQHLHPRIGADGVWRVNVRFPTAGSYRVLADFTHDGAKRTLGTDVQVAGAFTPGALPAASTAARSDGGLVVRRRPAMFVQFRYRGRVHTAAFTQEVGQ